MNIIPGLPVVQQISFFVRKKRCMYIVYDNETVLNIIPKDCL